MARGDGTVDFNPALFDKLGKSAGVERITRAGAERTLSRARSAAPVDEGGYLRGLQLQRRVSAHRVVWRVVGDDWKTMILEARGGYLARALKGARGA